MICIIFCLAGHSAQRELQQLDSPACRNCSHQHGAASVESTSEMADNRIVAEIPATDKTLAKLEKLDRPTGENELALAAAVAAAEIISPDEALPEEMVPDQESPAFQPPVIKTEPQQQPSPIPENPPQQQEHAQQQESLKIDEQHRQRLPLLIPGDKSPLHSDLTNAQSENMSRTLLNLETNKLPEPSLPVHSNLRTAKIQSAQIGSLRGAVRTNSLSQEQVQQQQQQPKVGGDEENLPVLTSSLYQAGHYLPPKDVCPEQGEGMKLMILVTTAPGHAAQREAVRSTWGHVAFRRDVGMAFMVGTSKNQSENLLIQQENFIYGDVIQVTFLSLFAAKPIIFFLALELYNVSSNAAQLGNLQDYE